MSSNAELMVAVAAAIDGNWDEAHSIAQSSNHPTARWIHAVLHKIEGDEWNSRYWYAKTDRRFEDFSDPISELNAIKEYLSE